MRSWFFFNLNLAEFSVVTCQGSVFLQTLAKQHYAVKEEGRRCSMCRSRDAPAALGGAWWSRDPPAACAGPHTRVGDAQRRLWPCRKPTVEQTVPHSTCGPKERGALSGAGLLTGPLTTQVTHTGAACYWRTAPDGKGSTLEQFMNCSLWEGLTLEKLMEDCLL